MRILYVIGSAALGGAESQLVRTAAEMQRLGHSVEVALLFGGGPLTATLDSAGVGWRMFDLRFRHRPLRSLLGLVPFVSYLGGNRFDIAHAFLAESIVVTFPVLRAIQPRTRRVAGVRGSVTTTNRLALKVYGHQLRSCHAIIANSVHLVDECQRIFGVKPGRVNVVPNGVDLPNASADVTRQPPLAVVVANFIKYKGHAEFVGCIAGLERPLQVSLVGDGPERHEVEGLVSQFGLEDHVHFMGSTDARDVLCESQFGVHPSKTEGLSNAILEEISYGLPVVAWDVGGNGSLVLNGVNGYLLDVGDLEGFRTAIESLQADVDLRTRFSLESKRIARQFTWDACIKRLDYLYAQVLTGAERNDTAA